MEIKPDEIGSILQAAHRGHGRRLGGPLRGRHRARDRRRNRPRPRDRQLHGAGDARAAPRRGRPGAQPRVRQRRRRALRRLGQGRRGRHRQAHRQAAGDPGRRAAARPPGRPARPPARRQGRHQHHRDAACRVEGPRRRPPPAGRGADADRPEGSRLDDPDRPRPARADHRRPPDRQDGDRDRHDHQQQGLRPGLHLRRDRAAHVHGRAGDGDPGGGRGDGEHDHRRRLRRRGRADQVHGPLRGLRDGRALPLQRQARPLHLRRPLQARRRLPRDVAAAEAPAGPRGLSGRRLLPALAAAGAGREALRRAGRGLADGAADHRDAGRRHLGLHPDQRDLDHRRPDLPGVGPVLLGRAPGDQRRHLGQPGRRQRPDQGDEEGGRQAAPRPLAVPRAGGVRAVRLRARPRDPEAARPRRAHGRGPEPERAPADERRRAGGLDLRRQRGLPRPDQGRARVRVPAEPDRAPPRRARGAAGPDRRDRPAGGRRRGGAAQGADRHGRRLRARLRRGGQPARGGRVRPHPLRGGAGGGGPHLGESRADEGGRAPAERHYGEPTYGNAQGSQEPDLERQERSEDHARDGDGRRGAAAPSRAADRRTCAPTRRSCAR